MTKFCLRQSAPMLYEVWINFVQPIDISNFMDSKGFIPIREDGKFFDTSNIVEDTERNVEAYRLQKKAAEAAKLQVEGIFPRLQTPLSINARSRMAVTEKTAEAAKLQVEGIFPKFQTPPSFKTRARKAVTEKTAEAAKLLEEGGTFEKVGEANPLVQTPYQKPSDSRDFETRVSTKKKIMEALMDQDDVSIIGICGMAGVGKTTMANEIANEVKLDKLFDEVAMAVVSQDPNEIKIQGELADMLGLEIEEKYNISVRAERLRKRFGGDRGKRTLIILDDVWEEMDLGIIGITSAGDDKNLKILLTSRFEDVCNNMGAQRNFQVNILSEKESWELFKVEADISDDATDVIKSIAIKVARECCGLPLALVTVGRALRKKEEDVWKNALEELHNSSVTNIRGMHKFVYSRIELSYNFLESDDSKSLLLLISMFPEGHSIAIEDLVRHAWELKLFKGTKTLSTTRFRVNSNIDYLKSFYLLLSVDNEESVKLHDVVRDFCLQIASKDKHAFMSKFAGLNFEGVTRTQ